VSGGAAGTPIRAVVSDFGGVLTTPLFESFAAFQAEHGIAPEALGLAMLRATQARGGANPLYDLETGDLAEPEFLALVADALEAETGARVPMEGFADRYWAGLRHNDAFIAYLRSLREERGIRLALLTNNVREWEPRWRPKWPIDELFEVVVDSAFVRMRKPDPRIYALTLEMLGLPPEACAFVDDLELNCDAARQAGLHPVVFRTTEQAIAELDALLGAG